ncbi:MAG TPA: metallopeptidase TldD-related protein [Catenuloplanes sp.]
MDAVSELELAGRVVQLVREVAGPAGEAEVFVLHTAEALTRFANSTIHQNVADVTTQVRLRLHLDGRTATGSTTVISPDGLRGLVERTVGGARLLPPDAGWPGLAPPQPLTHAGGFDEAAAQADANGRAQRVRAFVDAAGGLETAGYCRTTYRAAAFANTAGQSVSGRTAEAAMDGVARDRGADGTARLASSRLADLDGAALGVRAAAKARAGADPVELPPGRYEVVLEPTAVADVLQNLASFGFNGKAYAERRSFAQVELAQFDPAVTIVDDPGAGLGLPFDAEGTPKRRLLLVDAGVTRSVCHDRRTAAEVGAESTGHAVAGSGVWGPLPANLGLAAAGNTDAGRAGNAGGDRAGNAGGRADDAGGRADDAGGDRAGDADGRAGDAGGDRDAGAGGPATDRATAALVAGMERGLLVTDFWYTRVLDPKSLVVTGLTRNGVWLVEQGEITAAVGNLRFTQSYPQALAPGGVRSVGSAVAVLPEKWGASWWTAPPLHLASWNFTGGASG